MQYVDYYKVLELERSASPEEITKAYRRLARQCHPDVNHAPGAEDQFKRINEAHQVLSDPEKRRRYDALGPDWRDGEAFRPPPGWGGGPGGDGVRVEFHAWPGGGGGGSPAGWSDFFEAFFGGARGGGGPFGGPGRAGGDAEHLAGDVESLFGAGFGGGRTRRPAGPRAGGDLEAELALGPEDALHGGTRTLQLRSADGTTRTYEVRIPAGVRDGQRIRLAGQGRPGARGGAPGDLLLTVRIAGDDRFAVEGDDLVTRLPLAPWDAALGTTLRLHTPDGEADVRVPPGRSSGDRLRLREKGLPRAEGGRGDLLVELRLVVPERLTDRERELFEELRRVSPFKP